MTQGWIVDLLNMALRMWGERLTEIWELLSESPQTFKNGDVWEVIVTINGALQAVGYALLILFFAMGIFKSAASLQELKRPEAAFRHFIRFGATKTVITYGLDILLAIFDIVSGVTRNISNHMGNLTQSLSLPAEMITVIEDVGFLSSIPLLLITIIGVLLITVLSFKLILTVYGRMFRIFMYAALSPVLLSSFGGEVTAGTGKAYLRSFVGVCLEGSVILLCCAIYNAYIASPMSGFVLNPDASAVTNVFSYLVEVIFNFLILVGMISGADRIVKEMTSL